MEIAYSNFALDAKTFGNNSLVGLIDNGTDFIYERVYDIRKLLYNRNARVKAFLHPEKSRKSRVFSEIVDDFDISSEIESKKIGELSHGEFIKVMALKLSLSDAKVVILNHIDTVLTSRELNDILKGIKKHLDELNKTFIFSTNKVDKIVSSCTRYIVVDEEKIQYNGTKFEDLPIKTEICEFVDEANKKHAKLTYYKEVNDLLKAIYRSVEK